jgi:hypothetical protein
MTFQRRDGWVEVKGKPKSECDSRVVGQFEAKAFPKETIRANKVFAFSHNLGRWCEQHDCRYWIRHRPTSVIVQP